MNPNIFTKRKDNFIIWRVGDSTSSSELIIGQLQPGTLVSFVGEQRFALRHSAEFSNLWFLSADACNLQDDRVYHYWFEITGSHPERSVERIRVTGPLAYTVDWRLLGPKPADSSYKEDDRYPAAVI